MNNQKESVADFLRRKAAEASSNDLEDEPIELQPISDELQARIDEEKSILVKPQPRSNGRIDGIEI